MFLLGAEVYNEPKFKQINIDVCKEGLVTENGTLNDKKLSLEVDKGIDYDKFLYEEFIVITYDKR